MKSWIEKLAPHDGGVIDDSLSDERLVRAAAAEIGESACAWAVESARRIITDVEREFVAGNAPAAMTGHEGEAFEAGLLTTLMAVHSETPASAVVRPRGAEENVRLSARQGVPVGTLLRVVWSCHTRTHDALLRELESLVEPGQVMSEMRHLNSALYAYVDLYVKELTTEYQNELIAWSGHIPAERLNVMSLLLAGEEPTAAMERTLGLRLTDRHLVGVAWQVSGRPADRHEELTRFGDRLTRALGAASNLTLHHDGITDFWWTFAAEPRTDFAAAITEAELPAWAGFAVGDLGDGVHGFREAHFQAHQASRVGRRAAHGSLWIYRDVRVVALLSANETAARRFVREELAGLVGTEPKIAELRATLRHFLRNGSSRLAAARELRLAPNTVAYRVARASELLGRPATGRPSETLLALELAHHFPGYLVPETEGDLCRPAATTSPDS